ncbi:MAG: DUF4843 domain-containing protein [Rikenellaceae bacterium]|nr:DUF4843 domain-containing protein [Rikenellaceae bacterium]MCL2692490.1 DUF4843 domain-containing protein [Rikenellaceae bacterium]
MKTLKSYISCVLAVVLFCACEDTNYLTYDRNEPNRLYFPKDSIGFIYGFNPDRDVDLLVEVGLIGFTGNSKDTPFTVTVDEERSTAVRGVHYLMPETGHLMRDSVRGWIALDFQRPQLEKGETYTLVLELTSCDTYQIGLRNRCVIHFGDKVIPPPIWWTTAILDAYNQEKYILLVEYFHAAEMQSAFLFGEISNFWGCNLDEGGTIAIYRTMLTDFRYEAFFRTYVLLPMWEYYVQSGDETYRITNPNL